MEIIPVLIESVEEQIKENQLLDESLEKSERLKSLDIDSIDVNDDMFG